MGNSQYKHANQRHKSHPNIASINRKASTSKSHKLPLSNMPCCKMEFCIIPIVRIVVVVVHFVILSFGAITTVFMQSIIFLNEKNNNINTAQLLWRCLLNSFHFDEFNCRYDVEFARKKCDQHTARWNVTHSVRQRYQRKKLLIVFPNRKTVQSNHF